MAIRELATVDDVVAAAAVLREVWRTDRDSVPTNLMIALAHTGNYVVGLYDDERLVGASVAFFASPAARSMHSHITGVLPEYQSMGLGRVLKQHQRAWALARDVGTITWTFDPLVARNARFNLSVLGARATAYVVDMYGRMNDGVNRGDETDRILVSWAVASAPARTPVQVAATVAVPADIHELRKSNPSDAAAHRVRVREELRTHLDAGLIIAGFDTRGYLLVAS